MAWQGKLDNNQPNRRRGKGRQRRASAQARFSRLITAAPEMRCRLSPTADVLSHTSGQLWAKSGRCGNGILGNIPLYTPYIPSHASRLRLYN
jgi:hypothetical protein